MKCNRESDGRKLDHITLQAMRMQAVKAVGDGMSVKEVAKAYGLNQRTVFKWLADFASGGQNALRAKPISGRPPLVTQDEMYWIAEAVRDNTPLQFKFEFGLWTLKLIGDLINRQFGKKLSDASVMRIMKLLGFSCQKPLYQAWQQDPVLVRKWVTETYPAIKAKAAAAGGTIYFTDEAGIRSDYHTGTTWALVGQTPVVAVTGSRFSFNMLSAVSPGGGFRFMIHEGSCTAETFIEFLKHLLVGETKPVFVVADGASIHTAKLVVEYVKSQEGKLELFTLPPYSPQLNPDETVWAHVKAQVSKRLVKSKEEMKTLALNALLHIQQFPDMVKSFFQQQECQYAA